MGRFLYPLDKKYYDNNSNGCIHGATTRVGHGVGKLDFPTSTEMYEEVMAMADGEVINCGRDIGDTPYIHIDILTRTGYEGVPFVIRYYHVTPNSDITTGKMVKQGDKIGVTKDENVGNHLHLDMCQYINGSYTATVQVPCLISNYPSEVQERMNTWASQAGGSNQAARMWEIMAYDWTYLTPNNPGGSIEYDERVDASRFIKNDNDWLAVYGMLTYEEGELFPQFEKDNIKAIFEWIIRVFRNRLISGTSIESICLWDYDMKTGTYQPGYNGAVSRGKNVPEEIRQFCRDIISGKNYFYVEREGKKNIYQGQTPSKRWYDKLYSACTFYGGHSARWPEITFAQIPFESNAGLQYFYMDGEYTENVLKTFYGGNASNESKIPNPFLR